MGIGLDSERTPPGAAGGSLRVRRGGNVHCSVADAACLVSFFEEGRDGEGGTERVLVGGIGVEGFAVGGEGGESEKGDGGD